MSSSVHLCGTWSFCASPFERYSTTATTSLSSSLSNLILNIIEDVELNPNQPTVGAPGSAPNSDGVHELDAAWMRTLGRHTSTMTHSDSTSSFQVDDGEAGAVLSLRGFNGAIRVAHQIALKSPHSILTGKGAHDFAIKTLMMDECEGNDELKRRLLITTRSEEESPTTTTEKEEEREHARHQDTLGVVALRRRHINVDSSSSIEIIAAVSTSGLGNKSPGRVGDSALFGSGLFVDGAIGAVTATGDGDCVALFPISFVAVQEMKKLISNFFEQQKQSKTIRQQSLPNFVDLACRFAIQEFIRSSNVTAFVRKRNDVKNRLSEGGPLIGLCGVCYFEDEEGQVIVQTGGACCEKWTCEFVTSHLSFDEEKGNEQERKATIRKYDV